MKQLLPMDPLLPPLPIRLASLLRTWAWFVPSLAVALNAAPRVPWTSNRVAGSPLPPAPYTIERLHPDQQFDHPVDFAWVPGTTRVLVAEQGGKLWSFDTRAPGIKATLAVDLARHRQPFDGILGITFHPGFATNHHVYINYNEPGGTTNGSHISRFTLSPGPSPVIDPSTERLVLSWLSGGHNGCTLTFGTDGFLYISLGDGASPDPPDFPYRTGQDISDLLASVLRIDVDHAEGTNTYSIPADNPFVQMPGARPEVWAFGFRNPFRMSIDPATGELWVGDVGWEQWEMIHLVRRGGNYGWSLVEGPNPNVRTDVKSGPGPILPPLVALGHADAASITGGRVYHGRRLSGLTGAYLYGDWETGKFWALRHDGDRLLSNEELCDTALKPVSFAEDPAQDLVILDYNGGLYRLVANNAASANLAFPRRLSETGLFASIQPLQPAPGTVPYQIAAPMWNDHATATWLLGVPGSQAIATTGGVGNIAGQTWFFPSNTVLARTLTLELKAGQPASRRHIETQLLHWDGQAWNPYSFRWNRDQTDAMLVPPVGTNEIILVEDPSAPGGRCETPWRFQSRTECLRCHNAWAGETLTLNRWQLSLGHRGGSADGPATEREFERFSGLGVLQGTPQGDDKLRLVEPHQVDGPLSDRARSWLHVNCSPCHRFGAGGTAAIHLNLDKPLAEMRAINEKPLRGDFGISNPRIIAGHDPYRSTLFYRICTEGSGRMPHIGSRLVDEDGVRLIRDWIASLPPAAAATGTTVAAGLDDRELAAEWQREPGLVPPPLATMSLCLAQLDRVTRPGFDRQARALLAAAARDHTNAQVRELFQRLLPPEERRRTLGLDFPAASVLGRPGDVQRGRALFLGAAQCVRCHACEGNGKVFGPDLTGISRKYSPTQLLEQIVFPSRIVAPEFKTTYVTLRDDSELTGFVVRRGAAEWTFRDEASGERPLKTAEIKEARESTVSVMPEGLLAPLTAQEAADLLAYLESTPPPKP